MPNPVTNRTALLLALRDGPAYGAELIRRVARASGGRVRLSPARIYPVLSALESERLVESWVVRPRGRRGARARTYYDLTVRGVEAAQAERDVLGRLLASPARWTRPRLSVAMRRRLEAAGELSEFVMDLRRGLGPAARSR